MIQNTETSRNFSKADNQQDEYTGCPNIPGCQVIHIEGFAGSEARKDIFIRTYCTAGESQWLNCRRFQVKRELNLCPAFVMPDSSFTIDEILDRLEQE